jgi:general secretion pathway protein C
MIYVRANVDARHGLPRRVSFAAEASKGGQTVQNALGRPDIARTVIVYAVTLAALLLLGVVLAYWTWVGFAPRAESRLRTAPESADRAGTARALFGGSSLDRAATAVAGSSIKLLGIAAATGGRPGYAIVQLEARHSATVREGNDIAPGIRLAEVRPDHVVLDRNGARETLAWPRTKKP